MTAGGVWDDGCGSSPLCDASCSRPSSAAPPWVSSLCEVIFCGHGAFPANGRRIRRVASFRRVKPYRDRLLDLPPLECRPGTRSADSPHLNLTWLDAFESILQIGVAPPQRQHPCRRSFPFRRCARDRGRLYVRNHFTILWERNDGVDCQTCYLRQTSEMATCALPGLLVPKMSDQGPTSLPPPSTAIK